MDSGQVSSQRGDGKKSAGKEPGKQQVWDGQVTQRTGARRSGAPKRDIGPKQAGDAKQGGLSGQARTGRVGKKQCAFI